MKAIRVKEFGGPEKLQLEEVTNPKPGHGQVVVKIDAAGVNPVDVYIRAGTYPRKPPLPYTPGTDGAGTILSVGEGVDRDRRLEHESTQRAVSVGHTRSKLSAKPGRCFRFPPMRGSRKAPRCMFPTALPIARYSRRPRLSPQRLC